MKTFLVVALLVGLPGLPWTRQITTSTLDGFDTDKQILFQHPLGKYSILQVTVESNYQGMQEVDAVMAHEKVVKLFLVSRHQRTEGNYLPTRERWMLLDAGGVEGVHVFAQDIGTGIRRDVQVEEVAF